jgi:hypothetical protein
MIIREDLSYSYERIANISIKAVANFKTSTYIKWKENPKFNIYTCFNLTFLDALEELIIEEGYIYFWLYENKVPVGIVIEPAHIYFKPYFLEDCLTIKEYSKHRLECFISE